MTTPVLNALARENEQLRARLAQEEERVDALADEYHREYVLASTHAVVTARLAQAEEALRQIAALTPWVDVLSDVSVVKAPDMARAALTEDST